VFRYSVEPGETGIAVGCVVRLRPDGLLRRDDVGVQSVDQLHSGLTLGPSEELIGNIIRLQVPARTDLQETDDQQVKNVQLTMVCMSQSSYVRTFACA
jgi:hypothetical protein